MKKEREMVKKCTQTLYVMIVVTLVSSVFVGVVLGESGACSAGENRSLSTVTNFQQEESQPI